MIPVSEAQQIINSVSCPISTETVSMEVSRGRVLSESVTADRDFPPFTRVAMDGYAIAFAQYDAGQREFEIQSIQAAGEPAKSLFDPASAIEVMTGAVLPEGTDTVIRYEDCHRTDGGFSINPVEIRKGQNAHAKGADRKKGDLLIPSGKIIGPAEIGVLATVGKVSVNVIKPPSVAIVSSGDELVPVSETPEPHQIRRSNVHTVAGLLADSGFDSSEFHISDNLESIRHELPKILAEYDIVILSGGVSMGKFDHIPGVLKEEGVKELFYKVEQRPGKPFWFGKSERNVVFALPGNPVSTFACSVRYLIPWLRNGVGEKLTDFRAELTSSFEFKPNLTYFLQVALQWKENKLLATPLKGHGSGDLANLLECDAFIELPAERNMFEKGEKFSVWPYRSI